MVAWSLCEIAGKNIALSISVLLHGNFTFCRILSIIL